MVHRNQLDELGSGPDAARVLQLYDGGTSVSAIARETGHGRHVVTAFLAENGRHGKSRNGVRERMLRHIRDHPGQTKTELAQRFGIHANTVTEYLRGTEEEQLLVQARVGGAPVHYSDTDIARAMAEVWDSMTPDEQARGMSRERYDRVTRELHGFDGRRRPSSALLSTRRYSSWSDACASVGIPAGRPPTRPVARQVSTEDALQAVVDYIRETGETTYAGYTAWASANGRPSAATVRNRYGRWSDVRRAALPLTAPSPA